MGVAGEAAEEGAAEASEMEKQWDLVFKALGLGCKSKALAQSSDLTCQGAGSPCVGRNKSFLIGHRGPQLWAESSFSTLPFL